MLLTSNDKVYFLFRVCLGVCDGNFKLHISALNYFYEWLGVGWRFWVVAPSRAELGNIRNVFKRGKSISVAKGNERNIVPLVF